MIYGFNSTLSPKNQMRTILAAGKINEKIGYKSLSKSKILTINDKINNYNDILNQRDSIAMISKSNVESASRSLKSSRLQNSSSGLG
jgi:hypothetical protein